MTWRCKPFCKFFGWHRHYERSLIYWKKSQFLTCLKTYKALQENHSKRTMQALILANVGEQTSTELPEFTNRYGRRPEFSLPYASQSNGSSKRLIRELWNMTWIMLLDTKCEKIFWESNLALKLAWEQTNITKNQHGYSIHKVAHWDA